MAPNRLARALETARRGGRVILDLTESNPTRCGFDYAIPALGEAREYEPDPLGLPAARQAVAQYYCDRGIAVRPQQILMTAGSSEAYGYLFRLLANPGDAVLVPRPSYPLFEFLARINDVEAAPYALDADHAWRIDLASVETQLSEHARAVVVVNPNNPTGSLLASEDRERLVEICRRRGLALIADEVFLDYGVESAAGRASSLAGESRALTFTLNGLSKLAALPQMKLGWMVAAGPEALLADAMRRLEVIADTYLSVGTPVQHALPALLAGSGAVRRQILDRCGANLRHLDEQTAGQALLRRLPVEAGWSVVLRVPSIQTDEEWALELLERDGVLIHPGHFFDFASEGYLVASLITRPEVFREGMSRLLTRVQQRAGP